MNKPPNHIPGLFLRFFRWFCHPEHMEELEGDLLEKFELDTHEKGLKFAKRRLRLNILQMLRPSVLKSFRWADGWNPAMYGNYSKIALRNIARHKSFSFINISGLAIGMCVSLLILTLFFELMKFDEFHEKKDRIYRVTSQVRDQAGRMDKMATSPMPLAEIMANRMDDVDQLVRIRRYFNADASANRKILPLSGHFADNGFFELFSFPLVEGDPKTALTQPFSIVITQKAAEKFFGRENAMGKTIKMGEFGDFLVTGILEDIPRYSHLQFEVLGSFSSLPTLEKTIELHSGIDRWDDVYAHYIYFSLAEGSSIGHVQSRLNEIAFNQYNAYENFDVQFQLQALLDIIPGPELSNKIGPSMTPITLIILSIIAFLILLSACFNYTNLSIARSLKRAREIGVRKVVGASRGQVAAQFLLESLIVALLALGLGVILFYAIRPGFYNIIPRAEQFSLQLQPGLAFWFVGFAVFCGFLGGIIPSVFLSNLKPVLTLKNAFSEKARPRFRLRKALITFQFVISIIFIAAASIVLKQYKYAFNKDLGFERGNILNVSLGDMDHNTFENEFVKIPEIRDISFSSIIAGLGSTNSTRVRLQNTRDSIQAYFMSVDDAYLSNHQFNMSAGSAFIGDESGYVENAVIVNQTFVEATPWDIEGILQESLNIYGKTYRIIGIVEDFNYTQIEEPILPFFFFDDEARYNYANLKIASSDIVQTMSTLVDTWDELDPSSSWSATFYEEQIERSYDFLKNTVTLFGFLAFLAISIACLGMLGMAMFAAQSRAREVSIRKVFGASNWHIFHSLSQNFYVLILVAAGIALPIVYFLFDRVILDQFAFRVHIGALEMLAGLAIVFVLGMLAIASQTWNAARVNPAKQLRSI